MRIKRMASLLIPAAAAATMGFYTALGTVPSAYSKSMPDGRVYQIAQASQEEAGQRHSAERPFTSAEKYHESAEFEDARNWYRMVIENFPNSPLAAEASVRSVNIDLALLMYTITMTSAELGIVTEKITEALEYSSDEYRRKGLIEAREHLENTKKLQEEYDGGSLELSRDYDVLVERYLSGYDSDMWLIAGVPATAADVEDMNITSEEFIKILDERGLDIEDYLVLPDAEMELKMLEDLRPVLIKTCYNGRMEEITTNGKLDPEKLKYTVGHLLYNSEDLHERGEQELKELIESIDDPYSEIRYEAEKTLEGKPIPEYMEELFSVFESLERLME